MATESDPRPRVPEMDRLIGVRLPVLDDGFVRLVDYMGDDGAVVQAARVSYGRGTRTRRDDRALIRYLMRHRHTSPFEMCEIKLHVRAPIFVARQWVRHRTASLNEVSARYSVLDESWYVPDRALLDGRATEATELARQSRRNRQGREAPFDPETTRDLAGRIDAACRAGFEVYDGLLRADLARELARVVLPLAAYTEFYWKIDLHNLLHFLELRLGEGAQREIRVYAEVILDLVRRWVPLTAEAFEDYRLGAVTLSRRDLELLRGLVDRDRLAAADPAAAGLTPREWRELCTALGVTPAPAVAPRTDAQGDGTD